ncbi:MAG: hypothetical protein RMI50_02275 [Aquificaceae bacterium]|nr:hypothetical protein [Aquificaceae bacterium]
MLTFLFAFFLLFSCQPLPKDIPLEKYRRQYVEGQVFIDESLKSKVPKGQSFLIISVRSPDNPMPLAVLRVKNPKFPYSFRITGKHKLSHERVMEGDVILTARLSTSDTAEAKKGDLMGSSFVKVGTKGLKVVINTEVE